MSSLYEKIGGQPTIEKVVDDFHKRILADSSVSGYFARTDMAKQRSHQIAFFSQIFDGPKQYAGRSMDKTHTGLSLKQPHFDTIVKHLTGAMATAGVSPEDTSSALARISALKDAILNK